MVFWRRKQPQPPVVSCYGKLPATGDFIRLNAAGHENAAFDEWLGSSVAVAKQTLGRGFQEVYEPTLGIFIYRGVDGENGDEPERGMVGVWAASGDSAGRHYPMIVSTSYDFEQMVAVGPALPIALWPFITAAYNLVANGRGLAVDDFLTRVAQIQPLLLDSPESAAASYYQWLQHQPMHALWDTVFGSTAGRHAAVYNVQATIEAFREQECPQTPLALHFPIGAGDAYAVAVWMDMTLRLAGWRRTVLNAFWTPQHDLVMHVGPPQVGTFREMISFSGEADYVTDLVCPPNIDERTARDRLGPLAEVVDNVDQSIGVFLTGLNPEVPR